MTVKFTEPGRIRNQSCLGHLAFLLALPQRVFPKWLWGISGESADAANQCLPSVELQGACACGCSYLGKGGEGVGRDLWSQGQRAEEKAGELLPSGTDNLTPSSPGPLPFLLMSGLSSIFLKLWTLKHSLSGEVTSPRASSFSVVKPHPGTVVIYRPCWQGK